jgi:hypothetical protein
MHENARAIQVSTVHCLCLQNSQDRFLDNRSDYDQPSSKTQFAQVEWSSINCTRDQSLLDERNR